MQVRRDNSWDVLVGGWVGVSLHPVYEAGCYYPHVTGEEVDPEGQAGGPQSHAGGAPDVNPELQPQMLSPPHAAGGSSGPQAVCPCCE